MNNNWDVDGIAGFLRYRSSNIAVAGGAALFTLVGVVLAVMRVSSLFDGLILVTVDAIAGAMAGFFVALIAQGIGGFLLGDNRPAVIALIVTLAAGGFGYIVYLQISAYKVYSVYAHVADEEVFLQPLDEADPRLISHGRELDKEVLEMDMEIDGGDGPESGKLRWYDCVGIDCDEQWRIMFD